MTLTHKWKGLITFLSVCLVSKELPLFMLPPCKHDREQLMFPPVVRCFQWKDFFLSVFQKYASIFWLLFCFMFKNVIDVSCTTPVISIKGCLSSVIWFFFKNSLSSAGKNWILNKLYYNQEHNCVFKLLPNTVKQ